MTSNNSALKSYHIPPQPKVVQSIQQAAPDLDKIATIIKKDPGISANVLSRVNSSIFNLPNQISSIQQAVSLLGLDQIINIINGLMLKESLGDLNLEGLINYWDTSADTALVAASLSRHLSNINSDDGYLLGLFHNCGIPVIQHRFPKYVKLLIDAYQQHTVSIDTFEERYLKTNHAVIGYYVAKTWKLPKPISLAIRDQNCPDLLPNLPEVSADLTCLLILSKYISKIPLRLAGCQQDWHWQACADHVLGHFQLSEIDLEDLIATVRDELQDEGCHF